MPIITSADLATHMYAGIINEITQSDSTIADRAITAAIIETKMYLARFDLAQLFGTGEEEPPVQDEYLKSLVKDITCWHIIRLSNTSIDYTTCRTAYQDAVAALRNIQSGQAQPQGWPYLDATATAPPGDTVSWTSNPKRENYY